ncbi:modifier of mdg4 isoform X2 [Drosophila grimshawi]|uniref:modifier of mdg4 isoform X2 n=1 Tax=Drosophila grimshawi TaxID=7222 RepID=UPI000C86EE86|nr:modifier of mdg4 isoform X2 [Drosophila grimshawi]
MADDEQFSLCWNNFNTNLSAGFHESLCRGDLVDVSLAAEGQIVKAHRLVLSVCSPFFRKMFTQMPTNTHAFVFLNNVSHSALKDLIQFMYCGEVNVKQDALPAFISTAESLQIKGLTDNDPPPQPPQEPTPPPPPAAPQVQQQQQQQQQLPAQRVQRQQQPRATARYKIETVDDGLDDKGTTQIVIQTSASPQATIVQQQQQHIQTQQQQLQTATTTTATLVSTNKRSAQRGSQSSSGAVKRSKTTSASAANASNVIDPLESTTETGTTTATSTQQQQQQHVPQQITVQTTVVQSSDTKVQQVRQQQAAQEEAEYIDLPMGMPTKSEPDYSEEHADVAGDGDTSYVEDDAYGEIRYDESYFTENEDAGAQPATNTSASVAATTSKAVVKQQSQPQSYNDSSFVDTGGDQGSTEAQAFHIDFADSKKNGGKLLVINGFRFFRNKKRGHLQYWKCRNYYKERCPAIAIHDESTLILRLCHQHQHMESNDIEIKPFLTAVKEHSVGGEQRNEEENREQQLLEMDNREQQLLEVESRQQQLLAVESCEQRLVKVKALEQQPLELCPAPSSEHSVDQEVILLSPSPQKSRPSPSLTPPPLRGFKSKHSFNF